MQFNIKKIHYRYLFSNIFPVVILCSLGTLIYSNTFRSPFHFDDECYIINNLAIRNIWNLEGIWSFFPSRFITSFSFALNYLLGQLNVFGYHLLNLAIHVGSAILVWRLAILIFSTPAMQKDTLSGHSSLVALFAALIFLNHPVQTESVTYIWQRCASLAGFFYLLSVCLYIKSRLLQIHDNSISKWRVFYVFSWIFALAGMFTKENALTLPLMIILCELCFFKTDKHINWKYAIPFLILLPILPILNLSFMQRFTHQSAGPGIYYFLTQLRVLVTYIRLLFVPLNQNLDYDYPVSRSLIDLPTLGSFLFLAIVIISAIRIFPKYRILSFGIFWFFLTLLPESSIIPLGEAIFEHRLYLPLAGFSLFLVSGVYYLVGAESRNQLVAALLIIIVTCYSILAYRRNFVWENGVTLWNDTVLKSGKKARPYVNRGIAYRNQGNLRQALLDFTEAIQLNPDYAEAYSNRGAVYQSQDNLKQALLDYTKAIELNPHYAEIYSNRGSIYQSQGNFSQALLDFNKAVQLNPNLAEAYYNRGNAYYNQGDTNQALLDFTKAIGLSPDYAEAYYNRGNVYHKQGNHNQAILDYSKTIEINPGFFEAYYNRGNVYHKQGNHNQAILNYAKAIELNPNLAEAYYNRALEYFLIQKYNKSWEDMHKAEELRYNISPDFIELLKKASGEVK